MISCHFYSHGIHLHHLPRAGIWDDSFRWTWGAAILLYVYWMVGWEDFVTNLEYLFQLPPKLLLPWVCFTGGGGVGCMMSKKYYFFKRQIDFEDTKVNCKK